MKRILLVTALLLSAGCGEKPSTPIPAPVDIVPLAVGNSWTYQTQSLYPDTGSSSYQIAVTGDTLIAMTIDSLEETLHWYKMVSSTDSMIWYEIINAGAYWYLYQQPLHDTTLNVISLAARIAAVPGETWLNTNPLTDMATSRTEVLVTDTVITVPAGIFVCHIYRTHLAVDNRIIWDAFYAPGIGRVRFDAYGSGPAHVTYPIVVRRSVLTAYQLN